MYPNSSLPAGDASVPAGVDPATVLPAYIRPYVAVAALNPMQAAAIPLVLDTTRNVVIAAPTGSGKTLVAEVALLQECRERGRAGVYLAPMRAIAAEKRDDWQRLERAGLRVYKTTGEDDAFDPARALAADIIVATPEKWDSIGRRALPPEFVARIGLIVMDEVHLVDEGQRGAGQEAMLARVPRLFPTARLIAMSGTLANAAAIARWLDAALHESRWRPVTLSLEIVPYHPEGQWEQDEESRTLKAAAIVRDTAAAGGATLVFCGSRKGVERCALALARTLGLSPPPRQQAVDSGPLRQALAGGVGFHHAGLAREDRAAVERLFRSGDIKALVATSTVAAGVNLPARAVVVRDLQLGTSDLSASGLLQMAGRAGRPGLETEGYCYVVAPEKDVARVKGMLGGHPVGSRLGDDLATHINTEIALGLVRSRADVADWYARTLHRYVAPRPADLDKPLSYLLTEGFVTERDGALSPTSLGVAASDLMIRVASAAALEHYIAAERARTADPDALETELLMAACGLPVEFDELPDRGTDDTLRRALAARDKRLHEWARGRLDYLAVAACLLSGLPVDVLPIENPPSVRAAVAREAPRYLLFLARRANERAPGAPDVMVAAADLATALEYGVADRGAGGLLDILRRSAPSDIARQRTVGEHYAGLRAAGVGSLKDALPYLNSAGQALVAARPQGAPRFDLVDGQLVARIAYRGRPVRAHVRVAGQRAPVYSSTATADLRALPIATLNKLGESGPRDIVVELVIALDAGPNAWVYARRATTVEIPAPTIDDDAVDRVLRGQTNGSGDDVVEAGGDMPTPPSEQHVARGDARRLVVDAPISVKRAGALIVAALPDATDRIVVVTRLLRRRTLSPAPNTTRPLHDITSIDELSCAEAAELACALLWAANIPARPLPAMLHSVPATAPAFLYRGRWYWLPVWPDAPFEVEQEGIERWSGAPDVGGQARGRKKEQAGAAVGWEVVACYRTIAPRALPFAAAALAPPPVEEGAGPGPGSGARIGPRCPACEGPMRKRTSARGEFWGCARYPACRGTRPV